MKTAIELIAEERERQINAEGWTPEHDDTHGAEEMAAAAGCYAMAASQRIMGPRTIEVNTDRGLADPDAFVSVPIAWPWHARWWKPTPIYRERELIKAGALIVAEIDRLRRSEALQNTGYEPRDCGEKSKP